MGINWGVSMGRDITMWLHTKQHELFFSGRSVKADSFECGYAFAISQVLSYIENGYTRPENRFNPINSNDFYGKEE